jgi:hypothetical protein
MKPLGIAGIINEHTRLPNLASLVFGGDGIGEIADETP